MSRSMKYLHLLAILLPALIAMLSCAGEAAAPRDFGDYTEVSIDHNEMYVRGNCLPVEIAGVSIHSNIHVTDDKITDIFFWGQNKIAVMTDRGKLLSCDFSAGSIDEVIDLGVPNISYYAEAVNCDEALIINPGADFEIGVSTSYGVTCVDKWGTILWDHTEVTGNDEMRLTGPFFDGSDFYFAGRSDNLELFRLESDGEVSLSDTTFDDIGYQVITMAAENRFYWVNCNNGPYYSDRDEVGYSMMIPWTLAWDRGLHEPILDQAGRFIGFNLEDNEDGRISELVILEKETHSPIVLDYQNELGLDIVDEEARKPQNALCASNGETILFTSGDYLMKYSESGLEVWHDDLDDYIDSMSVFDLTGPDMVSRVAIDNLFMWELFCDKTCEHFIILQPGSVMFGGDEIELIDFGSKIATPIQFRPDFRHACFGLDDGSIVVLNIEHWTGASIESQS